MEYRKLKRKCKRKWYQVPRSPSSPPSFRFSSMPVRGSIYNCPTIRLLFSECSGFTPFQMTHVCQKASRGEIGNTMTAAPRTETKPFTLVFLPLPQETPLRPSGSLRYLLRKSVLGKCLVQVGRSQEGQENLNLLQISSPLNGNRSR